MLGIENVNCSVAPSLFQNLPYHRIYFVAMHGDELIEFRRTFGNPRTVKQTGHLDPWGEINFDRGPTDGNDAVDRLIEKRSRFVIAKEFTLIGARYAEMKFRDN